MNARADWYEDPQHPHQWRYWDGTQWTDHTSPKHARPQSPVDSVPPSVPRPGGSDGKRVLLIVGASIIAAMIAISVIAGGGDRSAAGVPQAQEDFVAVAQKWREIYSRASDKSTFDNNEFEAKDAEYTKDHAGEGRDNEICALLNSDTSFEGWVGTVTDVHEDQGRAGLSIWLPGGGGFVALETSRYADDEMFGSSNMVSPGSPLFEELTSLREDQKVKVSGTFSPAPGGKGRTQCAGTSNAMYSDDLVSPDFRITLTAVEGL